MGRRNTVEVVITAKDKASKAFKDFDGTVGKLQKGLSAFAVVAAAKAAFELGKLGAASLRTKAAFEAISGGVQNATRNLAAMTEATRGALSQQEAMAAANQLMQMGLANSADELARVTKMAVRLGTAMGRDAGESIESFSLLLANQSIPRLDTFGISAGKTRARILELMEANKDLSRETAFMTAVMELGDTAMERLGDDTADTKTAFDALGAAVKDAQAAIGEELAPAIADIASKITPVVNSTANWLTAISNTTKAIKGKRAEIGRFIPIIGFLDFALTTLGNREDREIERLGVLGRASLDAQDDVDGMNAAVQRMVVANEKAATTTQAFATTLPRLEEAAADASDRLISLAQKQGAVTEAMAATSAQVALLSAGLGGAVSQQNRSYEESQESIREKIEELNLELEKYQARNGILVTSQDKLTIAQADGALVTGRLAEAQQALAENTDPEAQLQLQAAVARASQSQERANQAINDAQPFITNYGKKINEVTGEIEEWQGKLTELEAQHKIAMNSIVFDLVQARLAIDGWTEAEINLALVTAESMGLIDQETLATAEAINESLLAFAEGQGVAQTRGQLQQIGRDILAIPRSVDVAINVRTNTDAMFRQLGILQGEAEVAAFFAGNPPGSQGGGVGQGLTRVGEGGAELVNLPPRSRVFSNEASQMITNNNRSANLTINTSAPHEPIIDDFRMMEAFMGA